MRAKRTDWEKVFAIKGEVCGEIMRSISNFDILIENLANRAACENIIGAEPGKKIVCELLSELLLKKFDEEKWSLLRMNKFNKRKILKLGMDFLLVLIR